MTIDDLWRPKPNLCVAKDLDVEMNYEDVISCIQSNPRQNENKDRVLCRYQNRNVLLVRFVREGYNYFILKTWGFKEACSDFSINYKLLHVRWVLEYRARPDDIGRFELVREDDGDRVQVKEQPKMKFKWLAE